MATEKQYDPQEPLAITLTMDQWQMVQLSLREYAGAANASMVWWRDFCADKRLGATTAANYEKAANEAEAVRAQIEATIMEVYGNGNETAEE